MVARNLGVFGGNEVFWRSGVLICDVLMPSRVDLWILWNRCRVRVCCVRVSVCTACDKSV